MAEQKPATEQNPVYDYGPEKPKRDARRTADTSESDGSWGHGDQMWVGLVMIGIGLYFLLRSLNLIEGSFNWWSFFIILPGVGVIGRALLIRSQTGSLPRPAKGEVVGGIMMVLVGFIFLLELDWGDVWPVFLIVAGIAMFFGWWGGDEDEDPDEE